MTDDLFDQQREADIALTKAKATLVNIAAWTTFWTPALVAGVAWWVTR